MTPSSKRASTTLLVCTLLLSCTAAFSRGQTPAPAAAPAQPAGPVLEARIEKKIDTGSAKVGDDVTAKTLRRYTLPGGTDLPKGSKLVGKVTKVESRKVGDGNSMLTFRFDQAQLKGGAAIPIHGLVVAIGPSLGPDSGLGARPITMRPGTGPPSGLDPGVGLGKPAPKDEDDIPMGSSLPGVALGVHKDADWTTALEGFKCEVRLDTEVDVEVQLK
jgi:hypothetical protein